MNKYVYTSVVFLVVPLFGMNNQRTRSSSTGSLRTKEYHAPSDDFTNVVDTCEALERKRLIRPFKDDADSNLVIFTNRRETFEPSGENESSGSVRNGYEESAYMTYSSEKKQESSSNLRLFAQTMSAIAPPVISYIAHRYRDNG